MSEALYKSNVEYLKKRSSGPSFTHIVEESPVTEIYDVETTADGLCVFQAGEGTKVLIHSRRDPEGEAERQIVSWIEKNNPALDGLLIVPGFGGMFHIQALAARLKPGAVLLIVEKYPGIIRKALDYCDLRKISSAEQCSIIFIASPSDEGLRREYRHYLQTRKNLKISVFIHPGLSRAFPGVYEKLVSELKNETSIELMERNTRITLGPKWIEHAICNLPVILNSPGIDSLKDCHKGLPAIVVAAGPSLDESAEYLHKVRDKSIVIAVGRALKPLAAKGISPDYIISMDSDFATMQQFEGVNFPDSILLSALISYPGVAPIFAGRRYFFSTGVLGDFEKWLKSAGVKVDRLCAGGTVALSAIDAARFLGCPKIFFMGLDLAFKDDGTTHAIGTKYRNKEDPCGRIIQVKGNYKDKVFTSEQFMDYIKMLNSYLEDVRRDGNVDFYNVTTQGAALSNCELILPPELEKVLEGSPGICRPFKLPETENQTEKSGKKNLLGHINRSVAELRDAAVLANEMIDACGGPLGKVDYKSFEEKTGRIEKDIKKMELTNMLVAGALHGLLFKTMERSAESGKENAQEILKEFYSSYKDACTWVSRLLSKARKSYEKDKELTY